MCTVYDVGHIRTRRRTVAVVKVCSAIRHVELGRSAAMAGGAAGRRCLRTGWRIVQPCPHPLRARAAGHCRRMDPRWPVALAALCGFAVALCGLATSVTFRNGLRASQYYSRRRRRPPVVRAAQTRRADLLIDHTISGGISPSFAFGAGIGYDLASLLPNVPVDALGRLHGRLFCRRGAGTAYFARHRL